MISRSYFCKEFFCGIIKVSNQDEKSSSFCVQDVNNPPLMSSYWKPSHSSSLQYYHECCNNFISLFTQNGFTCNEV